MNEQFLERVAALDKGEKRRGAAISKALSDTNADTKISISVRAGSQMYARALTGINFGVSFINFAQSDLESIQKLTREIIRSVEKTASPNSSRAERVEAQRTIDEHGAVIKDTIRNSYFGKKNYLEKDVLINIFEEIGLVADKSEPLQNAFDQLLTIGKDGALADLDIKGVNSNLPREVGKPSSFHNDEPLFGGRRTITKAADAYAILDDLKAFDAQLTSNLNALNSLSEVLGQNSLLVRSTALAFIEIGKSINSETDAGDVARKLQGMILKDARAALSQAENLEPLIVATLNYKDAGITKE
ncbi:hypothetical protein EBR25_02445 [bacterium]|nr:hypothetical protein [bacterium]